MAPDETRPCPGPADHMTLLRRFAVVQLLMLWQGGFLFYSGFVVPVGTDLLGRVGQGAITARVTVLLNWIAVAALAAVALDLALARDPRRRRAAARWTAWAVAAACQALLFYLHAALVSYMDPDRQAVLVLPPFRPTHAAYLWAHTVQWVAGLALA
ncbi:MAG: hypothetical protein ACKODX_18830, partial [Gemmata sp.]